MDTLIRKAKILVEALPYIRAFAGKTLVIKYGGRAMTAKGLQTTFAQDVVLLKYVGIQPVIVHGGGPQISRMMARLGKTPTFVRGIRVTDPDTMKIVEKVLGTLNSGIVAAINRQGGQAVGLTGKDAGLLTARPHRSASRTGLAGEVERVNTAMLTRLQNGRFIPVIAPVGAGRDGRTYNVNADAAAGAIAAALRAEKLITLTDTAGVLDASGRLLPTLKKKEIVRLTKRRVIEAGMLPKVEACLTALNGGVAKAHIIDGRVPHALLLEVFTDRGVGTEILA